MSGLSVVKDTWDRNPVWHDLSWERIRELLSRHQYGEEKKAQPLFSPTRFEGGKRKECVQEIHFGVLDLDDIPPERWSDIERVASKYAAIAFSTWSHPMAARKGLVRLRLCVPFSRPATPLEWPSVHAALTQEFGGSADPACKDPNRCYYVPALPTGHEWAAWVWRSPGKEVWQVQSAPVIIAPSRTATDPVTEKSVRRLANRLARSEDQWARRMGLLLQQALDGFVVAEDGDRNTTLWELAGALAKEFPYVEPGALADIFRPCLSHMQAEGSNQTVEKFTDQVRRRQDAARLEYEEKQRTKAPVGDWRETLTKTDEGKIEKSAANAMRILRNDAQWSGVLAFNELTQEPFYRMTPPSHSAVSELTDPDITETSGWLDQTYGVSFPSSIVYEGICAAASGHRVNPVREYLESVTWDGKGRIGTWLSEYCGAEDTEINRIFGAKWLISAVARAFEPGCKADNCLLMKGEQDIKKTLLLSTLASEAWFCTLFKDLSDQDARQNLRGKWIVELGELEAVRKASINAVKQFLSEQSDHYRASYARTAKTIPRRCIFAGTTNEDNPLVDHTGNRRFWPVEVRTIDIDRVISERDSLWAEAVTWYRAGKAALTSWTQHKQGEKPCIWWLSDHEKALAKVIQAANRLQDDWEWTIREIVRRKEQTNTHEILLEMGITARQANTVDAVRVARVLKTLHWQQIVDGPNKVWIRTGLAEPRVFQAPGLAVVGKTA